MFSWFFNFNFRNTHSLVKLQQTCYHDKTLLYNWRINNLSQSRIHCSNNLFLNFISNFFYKTRLCKKSSPLCTFCVYSGLSSHWLWASVRPCRTGGKTDSSSSRSHTSSGARTAVTSILAQSMGHAGVTAHVSAGWHVSSWSPDTCLGPAQISRMCPVYFLNCVNARVVSPEPSRMRTCHPRPLQGQRDLLRQRRQQRHDREAGQGRQLTQ